MTQRETKPKRCSTCDSPQPHLHPVIQHGGEVQPCANAFHKQITPQNTPEMIANLTQSEDDDCGWWCDYCDRFENPIYERGKERCPNCNGSMRYGLKGPLIEPASNPATTQPTEDARTPVSAARIVKTLFRAKGITLDAQDLDFAARIVARYAANCSAYATATEHSLRVQAEKERDEYRAAMRLLATDQFFMWEGERDGEFLLELCANVNDEFYPGADAEDIPISEAPALLKIWEEKNWPGVVRFVQQKRGGQPLRKHREAYIAKLESAESRNRQLEEIVKELAETHPMPEWDKDCRLNALISRSRSLIEKHETGE